MQIGSSKPSFKIPYICINKSDKEKQIICNICFSLSDLLHSIREKEMAPHSSILAWRMPETEEPGELPSIGPHRVEHDGRNLAAAAAVTLYNRL